MAKGKNLLAVVAVVVVIVIIAAAALLFVAYSPVANLGAGQACVAQPGFTCSNAVYHSSGNITLTVGQSTGYNWAIADFIFVPSTAQYQNGVPVVTWPNAAVLNGGLADYSTSSITIPATGSVYAGTAINGTIWASYQQQVGGTVRYVEIGAIKTVAR